MNERRYQAGGLRIEYRAEGDMKVPVLRGHAARFDVWTTLYEYGRYRWREILKPGAFANAIAERQDVRGLFNHDPNHVLFRTKSNTLTLVEDELGLTFEGEVLDSQTNRDLVIEPVRRGDLDGCSFAFTVRKEGEVTTEYERDGRDFIDRELRDVNLWDVSVVTYPQYDGTDVSVRSAQEQLKRHADRIERARRDEQRARWEMRLRLAEAGGA